MSIISVKRRMVGAGRHAAVALDRLDGSQRPPLRRADWRFLLPMPPTGTFRHLVLLGGPDGLDTRLGEAGIADHISRALPADRCADAVIILNDAASRSLLKHAARSLVPGGVLYCELSRRVSSSVGVTGASLDGALRRLSLSLIGRYWPVPGFDPCTRYIPIDSPGALRWYASTVYVSGTPARRLLELGARMLTNGYKSHRVAPLLPWHAFIAVAGARRDVGSSVLRSRDVPVEFQEPGIRPLLLTSGVDNGSRVVILPFGPSGDQPMAVIKIARLPEFNGNLQQEQRTLAELRSRLDASLRETIPVPMGMFSYGDLAGSIESCARGRSLFAANIRWRATDQEKLDNLRLAAQWLTRFHRQTHNGESDMGAAELARRAVHFCERYARGFGTTSSEQLCFEELLARARELSCVSLQLVWQHHDFGPWNVHVSGSDITVIDWELGLGPGVDRVGLPLCDLLYFITHWYHSARHLYTASEERHAFYQLFLASDEDNELVIAARRVISEYMTALEIDRRFFPVLLTYTWIERAVKRLDRRLLLGTLGQFPRTGDQFVEYVSQLANHRRLLFPDKTAME